MNCSKLIDICVDRWLWFHVIPLTILRKIFPPSSPSNCFVSKSVPCNSIHSCGGDFARTSKSWRDTPGMLASYPPGWRRIHGFFGWGFLETLTFATGILGGVFSPTQDFYVFSPGFFSRRDSWKQKESWMCKVSLGHSIIFANIAKKCSNETAGKEKVGYTFWQPGSLCFVLWTLWCPFGRGAPLHL